MTATKKASNQLVKNLTGFFLGWLLLATCFAWKWQGELHPLRSLGMSFVAWLIIYAPMYKTFWKRPGSNHGIVLERALYPWETPSVSDDNNRIEDATFIPKNQRGSTAAWVATGLFEVQVGESINFVRTTKLGSTIEIPDKNGAMYSITWQAFLTAVRDPDFMPRYLLVSEEASEEFFTAGYLNILQSMFAFRDGKDVMLHLKKFNKIFNKSYGGDNYLHDDEKEHGRSNRDAAIKKIVPINKVAEAMQLQELAKAVAKAIEILVDGGRGMSKEAATRFIMSQNGGVEFSDIQFTGGIPPHEVIESLMRKQRQQQGKKHR